MRLSRILLLVLLFHSTTIVVAQNQQVDEINAEIQLQRDQIRGLEAQIKILEARRDSVKKAVIAALPSSEKTPRVILKATTSLFDGSGSRTKINRPKEELTGVFDDAERVRIHFVGDDGTTGWIGDTGWELESDGEIFLQNMKLKPGVSRVVTGGLVSAIVRYNKELRTEKEREESRRLAQQQREADRKIQEEEFQRVKGLQEQGINLLLHEFDWRLNSAGGVEPIIRVANISSKTVKYVSVFANAFNSVGDPENNTLKDRTNTMRLKLVGPVESGQIVSYDYDGNPPFYNNVVSCFEVSKIVVDYIDGTNYTMVKDLATMRRTKKDFKIKGECSY
jgi:hypothetical protein